jgi:NhaP-type Na+/H+ or K+/H+ antiporter
VLSLAVIRPLSVAVSLIGSRFSRATVGFMGWFGPRGLASIVFGFMVLEKESLTGNEVIFDLVAWTVLLSTFGHGLTAQRGVSWYARHADALAADPAAPETQHAPEVFGSRARLVGAPLATPRRG